MNEVSEREAPSSVVPGESLHVKRLADDDQKAWIEAATQAAEYNKEDNFFGMLLSDLRTSRTINVLLYSLAGLILFAVTLAGLLVLFPNLSIENPKSALLSFLDSPAETTAHKRIEIGEVALTFTIGAFSRSLLLLALACSIALAFILWNERATLTKQIRDIKEYGARQIYPCSGQITFTCGTKGIRISNSLKSVSWQISWGALAGFQAFVEVRPSSTITNRFRSKKKKKFALKSGRIIYPGDEVQSTDIEKFTHFVIYTKTFVRDEIGGDRTSRRLDRSDRPNLEYLVIPLRFFSGAYDRTNWAEFIRLVRKHSDADNTTEGDSLH